MAPSDEKPANDAENPSDTPVRGSLRDALRAASRTIAPSAATAAAAARERNQVSDDTLLVRRSALAAARATPTPPVKDATMTDNDDAPRTMLVRGKQAIDRSSFHQDPVVAWLVVVGGPGLGAYRPVFEGNNSIGRAKTQRIPIDFGDEGISNEEQAYLRYDSADRRFLFVPNLAKTNVVSVNNQKPTGAVELQSMDVILMGRTQLAFVPFCGPEFDWAELTEAKR
ncbi:MAG: hypothetical protein RL291_666 [Pseudomonadota bacterium]